MFSDKKDIIKEMFEVGAHFGFSKTRRHPSTTSYILGRKDGVEIFDLKRVEEKLNEAKEFVSKIASEGKQILFVGGKKESQEIIKLGAQQIEMPYVAGRFIGGTITNFDEIRKRVNRLSDLNSQKDKGELGKYTKKERLLMDREAIKLDNIFGGIMNMNKKPAALFIIDADKESIARDEAIKSKIPVISLCSSDCNFTKIDFPIPGNDSSTRSITFFVNQIIEAYKEGVKNKNNKSDKK